MAVSCALLSRCSASITLAKIVLIGLRCPGPFDFNQVSTSFWKRNEISVVLEPKPERDHLCELLAGEWWDVREVDFRIRLLGQDAEVGALLFG